MFLLYRITRIRTDLIREHPCNRGQKNYRNLPKSGYMIRLKIYQKVVFPKCFLRCNFTVTMQGNALKFFLLAVSFGWSPAFPCGALFLKALESILILDSPL